MSNTKARREAIARIIRQTSVNNQEELQQKLQEEGIASTQATLSRDLKALQIVKVSGKGYRLPAQIDGRLAGNAPGRFTIEFSGQNAVIKSPTGYAPAIAARIDAHPCAPIMATLAGDDVVLLLLRQGFHPEQVLASLYPILPGLTRK